ncbi:MAG TPA: 2Fe-2S iron-sulfur cluster-binding protein, partial [Methanomassiliicoccales archaeon]|nr:2Fe-2S iron-sulfur cluster-binding protein [Methanomassiliicoccales archaeon]
MATGCFPAMKFKVRFIPDNATAEVARGTTLLDSAIMAGVDLQSTCGGKGSCGKCRVVVEGETDSNPTTKIAEELLARGHRLACQTYVVDDVVVRVPEETRMRAGKILTSHSATSHLKLEPMALEVDVQLPKPDQIDNVADLERLARALNREAGELHVPIDLMRALPRRLRSQHWKGKAFLAAEDLGGGLVDFVSKDKCQVGAALDIGTTTVVLSLVDLNSGKLLSTASEYNKQMRAGDDVIARIAHAEEGGLDELQRLVLDTVKELLREARKGSDTFGPCDLTALSVAGNTTMIHLFLGLDPSYIRQDPYIPATNVPLTIHGRESGLPMHPHGLVYCIPGRAGFVGGDITADVLASGMHQREELSLLIDVGTNGEVVLGNDQFLVACST